MRGNYRYSNMNMERVKMRTRSANMHSKINRGQNTVYIDNIRVNQVVRLKNRVLTPNYLWLSIVVGVIPPEACSSRASG